ncbi:hypothetical protein KEG38_52485 [Polyangium jinanense]|uniref:hypothetical protein n=1 Tax=Polyangium jinanense TaxID=2829994 RepID=UPI0023409D13|nr:hypothetical protein [Polyangium jinanense]MDC3962543.1 hypothetical protein [Polyangium jinanense]
MKFVDDIGLGAAQKLETAVGPFVALPAYKRLLVRTAEPSFAARAALGALRCAVRLGEEREIEDIAAYWSTLSGSGPHLPAILELCRQLARFGRKSAALTLAGAEVEREESARALYLLGRMLELTGDGDGAFVAFGKAAARADAEKGAADVAVASRARRVERLLGDRTTAALAVADAASADPAGAPPDHKLVIALGRLRSPSRFVRASGLSLLEELGRDPTTSLGRLAIRLAAEHADALGDALTPLEADRVAATLRHVPDDAARENALARLAAAQAIAASRGEAQAEAITRAGELAPEIFPLVCRARATLTGGGQGDYGPSPSASTEPSSPSLRLASLGLAAYVALGKGRPREAAEALTEATDLVTSGGVGVAPPVWTAARAALGSTEPLARAAGVRLCEVLLSGPSAAPPGGHSAFALALARAGRTDLAVRAARDAVTGKESSARALLGSILREQGWALAAAGQRELAIAALVEAKEHLAAAGKDGARGR